MLFANISLVKTNGLLSFNQVKMKPPTGSDLMVHDYDMLAFDTTCLSVDLSVTIGAAPLHD